MVLNVVISAPRKVLGDLRPSVAQFLMSLDDEHIFLLRPLVLLDVRVQVVVPSVLIINKWNNLTGQVARSRKSLSFKRFR